LTRTCLWIWSATCGRSSLPARVPFSYFFPVRVTHLTRVHCVPYPFVRPAPLILWHSNSACRSCRHN
jgi:hypothetical protein